MQLSAQSFQESLARYQICPAAEVSSLHAAFQRDAPANRDNPAAFAAWLIARKKLTEFQSGLLLKGRGDRLQLGEYTLVERIGQGRMAGVYEARHRLGQRVAIKILPPSRVKDPNAFGRFQREARLARKLKHPNIVRTFQSGQAGDLHYLVMEYLEGETLEDVLKRRGFLPALEAARLIHQTLLALQHLHEQSMVHRDLKPGNLMLVPSRKPGVPDDTLHATVKLLDIGLGRALFDEGDTAAGGHDENLTAAGDMLGSPDYMPPEQARDAHSADIRSDIYSVGCVMYHTLTGTVPFPEKNFTQKMVKHATFAPLPLRASRPELPEGLQVILDWMIAKDPGQRYPTPDRAAQALQVFLVAGSEPAPTLEADVDMASYLNWLQSQQAVEDDARINVEVVRIVPPASPKPVPAVLIAKPVQSREKSDEEERILGLSLREWTLMSFTAAGMMVTAVLLLLVFGWLLREAK